MLGASLLLVATIPLTPLDAVCGRLDDVLAALAAQAGEVPAFSGGGGSRSFVLTINRATASWSAIVVMEDGKTGCIVAMGQGVAGGDPA